MMTNLFDQDKIENWIDELCVEPRPLSLSEKVKVQTYPTRLSLKQKFVRVTAPIWGVIIVLGMLSIFVGVAIADDSCTGYEVKTGDTLWDIAMANGVETTWITSMNDIANPDLIQVGQCLQLPGVGRTYAAQGRYIANNFTADGPTPGAIALGDALQTVYPQWGYTLDETYGISIFNPRPVRGGTAPSTHSSGLALDFLVTCDGSEALFNNLVENAEALGIERIILCNEYWRVDNGIMVPSEQLANLHNGVSVHAHAHIELTIEAGANLTYEEALAIIRPVPPVDPIPIDESQLPIFEATS